MRLIRTLVPSSEVSAVRSVLDEHDIDYVIFEEDSEGSEAMVVEFPLPTQGVETVLDDLRETTSVEDTYTVVASVESVFSEHDDELEERFITGSEEDDSIATEEIRSTALDLTPSPVTYYAMTLLSVLVATAGLLLDSPAIVVGSMVIAPLVGSSLTASVGTVLLDREMMVEGFRTQLFGLLLAVAGATVFSVGLKSAAFLPPALDVTTTQQISQRISPGLLSLTVGLCAGAAGAFGLATGVSVTLVGVMVAAALIPAAAAVGVGIAWGVPAVALGAFVLLVLNVVSIHVSGVTVLWYLGYRPAGWPGDGRAESDDPGTRDLLADGAPSMSRERLLPVAVVAVVLLAVVALCGAVVAAHVGFEQSVNQAVGETLEEPGYEELELVVVQTQFDGQPLVSVVDEQQVTVVVTRDADRRYPDLHERLDARVEAQTGRDVSVVVQFVERQSASDRLASAPDGAKTYGLGSAMVGRAQHVSLRG
ncbi:TIGR00341 family protein [Haloarchaeobius baliensis]|uniref:TIGR00341 family protein n=1 Tax=Haloarchaeobius baliensis TaxID=1670458 RepID=UPI003F885CF8